MGEKTAKPEKGEKGDLPERDIQSVRRALDILETVAAAGEIGVTEISRRLGLHVATTHNLIRTLARYHYLANFNGRYRVGTGVAALAGQWDPLQALPEIVRPHLARISTESGEAASCSVLVGTELRLVAFQPGTQAITIHFPQLVWTAALMLATGRVLVANLDPARWPEFIAASATIHPDWDAAAWEQELAGVRERGYSMLCHSGHGGQFALAFPLRVKNGRVISAIGASAPTFRLDARLCETMFAAVRATAAEITAGFGSSVEICESIRQTSAPDWDTFLQNITPA